MEIARLSLGGYESIITLLSSLDELHDVLARQDLILADSTTASLVPHGLDTPLLVVPAGEQCKDLSVLERVLDQFVSRELQRDSTVAAFGGGAVTDLAAFATSIYLRGLGTVLVPTTLLAMVDAAVGGKTGIDFRGYKNMIGTFYPAREVCIVPDLLASLPDREFLSGLAEVIKAALLGDAVLLEILETRSRDIQRRDREILTEVIHRAVLVKCGVVTRDFQESGERAHLNLGHTFGHALESCLGFGRWTHGDAVAWGIARALETGRVLGITDSAWFDRVMAVLGAYRYPVDHFPVPAEQLLEAMAMDKKRRSDGIGFILQMGPFTTVQQTVEPAIIRRVLHGTQEVL